MAASNESPNRAAYAASTTMGLQYDMHRSERNFSRCVKARPTGTTFTCTGGGSAAIARGARLRSLEVSTMLWGAHPS